jgi:hypothetical protein
MDGWMKEGGGGGGGGGYFDFEWKDECSVM